jgi:hypothetical protein
MDEKSEDSTELSWTQDIETVLRNINDNSDRLQEQHRRLYLNYSNQLYYYRVPIIILSSINSVFSVGLVQYVPQTTTSVINCLISLGCACISAIELFVGVNKSIETSLMTYHGYKLLSIKISTCLKLSRNNRELEGVPFLKEVIGEYNKLLEQSIVITDYLDDVLTYKQNPLQIETTP